MKKEKTVSQNTASRRGFFLGAAAAGAAAAAVTQLPVLDAPAAHALPPAPENGGGYSLSEHVQRYYQTTRV